MLVIINASVTHIDRQQRILCFNLCPCEFVAVLRSRSISEMPSDNLHPEPAQMEHVGHENDSARKQQNELVLVVSMNNPLKGCCSSHGAKQHCDNNRQGKSSASNFDISPQ